MKMDTYYIDINIDDETGMDAIALVEFPAVEKNFLCFSQETPIKLQFNEEKHIITGVSLLADTPIYRYNETYGEHYVVFTPEVIEKLIEKYSKNNLFNSVNLQHNDKDIVKDAYMIESYVINRDRGIDPKEFRDTPNGSWITSFKIENENLWNEIVNGHKINGFSIQGLFTYKEDKKEIKNPSFDDWVDELIK